MRMLRHPALAEVEVSAAVPPKRPLPKLPLLRVYGVLALLVAASELLLFALTGPRRVPGHIWDTTFQGQFLAWLGIFVAAAGFASIAAVVRYRWMDPPRPVPYPGLITGTVYVLLFYLAALSR